MRRVFYRITLRVLMVMTIVMLLPAAVNAVAGVPTVLSYQGRLTDNTGALLGGTGTVYYFRFSIWDTASIGSGTKLWPAATPGTTSLTVTDGVFNVSIGDVSNGYPDALTYNFQDTDTAYLQIEVSPNGTVFETLGPRQRITSASTAINAKTLQGLLPGTGANNLLTLGASGEIALTSGGVSTLGNVSLGTVSAGTWNGGLIGDAYLTKTGNWTGVFDGQEGSYYLNAANLTNFSTPFATAFAAKTTDDLTEGTVNKYFTSTAFTSAFTGKNISLLTNDAGYITASSVPVLSVNGNVGDVVLTTSDLVESSRLYFTDERAQDSVGSILSGDFTYDDATPLISIASIASSKITGTKTAAYISDFSSAAQSALTGLYEIPLTFGTGLTRTANTITVHTTQHIAKLSNLTGNGFVKTSGSDGTLSVDTNTYLTGNQTITLSGDIAGTGTTTITTTLATVNTNTGSTGSSTAIPVFTVNDKGLITAASTVAVVAPAGTLTGTALASNVVSSSLTSVGTIATGTWQGSVIGASYGGAGTISGILKANGSGTVSAAVAGTDYQVPLTFSTGLTSTSNTITNNLSTGVSGGQSVIGGTESGNNLTFSSTSNATKGSILFGTSAYDEVNNRLGIGTTSPATALDVNGISTMRNAVRFPLGSGTNRDLELRATNAGVDNFGAMAIYPTSGTNVGAALQFIPRGTGYTSNIKAQMTFFNTDFIADSTNYEFMVQRASGTDGYGFVSGAGGTGVRRPIWFDTSGVAAGAPSTSALFIGTNNRIGVGTASPSYRLDVQSSDAITANFTSTSTGTIRIQGTNNTVTSSSLYWNATDFPGFYIRNTSNTVNATAGVGFYLGTNGNAAASIGAVQEAANSLGALAFYAGGSGRSNTVPERVRITSNGWVGIGTTAPATVLDMASADVDGTFIRAVNSTSTGTNKNFIMGQGGSSAYGVTAWQNTGVFEAQSPGGLGVGAFEGDVKLYANTSRTPNMVIKNGTGRVGIGTTTPFTIFDVNAGSALFNNAFNIYGASTLATGSVFGRISNTLTSSRTIFALAETSNDASTPFYIQRNGSTHATAPNQVDIAVATSTGALTLATNNTERMRINAAGDSLFSNRVAITAGSVATGQNAFRITGTMAATTAASQTFMSMTATSTSGGGIYDFTGLLFIVDAGYTGSGTSWGMRFINNSAGTGTNYIGSFGNIGVEGIAGGTTSGANVGLKSQTYGGNTNIGVFSNTVFAKNGATNVGVLSLGLNTGTSPIQVGGYFGLQATAPTFTSAALIADNGATTSPIFLGRDNGSTVFSIIDGGNVGIGTAGPGYRLDVIGAAADTTVVRISTTSGNACTFSTVTGSFSCASDSRLKHAINSIDATDALTRLSALNPVLYRYNWQSAGDSRIAGFIAQEFETMFPDLVTTDPITGYKSLSYAPLMPYVISAIQEMHIKIARLPVYDDQTMMDRLTAFWDAIAARGEAVVEKMTTKQLCVEDVCVTRDQFLRMVQQIETAPVVSGGTGAGTIETPPSDPVVPPVESPAPDPAPSDTGEDSPLVDSGVPVETTTP